MKWEGVRRDGEEWWEFGESFSWSTPVNALVNHINFVIEQFCPRAVTCGLVTVNVPLCTVYQVVCKFGKSSSIIS